MENRIGNITGFPPNSPVNISAAINRLTNLLNLLQTRVDKAAFVVANKRLINYLES